MLSTGDQHIRTWSERGVHVQKVTSEAFQLSQVLASPSTTKVLLVGKGGGLVVAHVPRD